MLLNSVVYCSLTSKQPQTQGPLTAAVQNTSIQWHAHIHSHILTKKHVGDDDEDDNENEGEKENIGWRNKKMCILNGDPPSQGWARAPALPLDPRLAFRSNFVPSFQARGYLNLSDPTISFGGTRGPFVPPPIRVCYSSNSSGVGDKKTNTWSVNFSSTGQYVTSANKVYSYLPTFARNNKSCLFPTPISHMHQTIYRISAQTRLFFAADIPSHAHRTDVA